MMPELGKYAATVLIAYGGSIVLIGGLIWISVMRSRRVRRLLDAAEARWRDG